MVEHKVEFTLGLENVARLTEEGFVGILTAAGVVDQLPLSVHLGADGEERRVGIPACTSTHQVNRLMLLGSPPDMVHSPQLRKTHSSTQQDTIQTALAKSSKKEYTPAVADFRYRAPLIPRLVWPYSTACKLRVTDKIQLPV